MTFYYRMASWKGWHFWGKILPNSFNGEERDHRTTTEGRHFRRKRKPGQSTEAGRCALCGD